MGYGIYNRMDIIKFNSYEYLLSKSKGKKAVGNGHLLLCRIMNMEV